MMEDCLGLYGLQSADRCTQDQGLKISKSCSDPLSVQRSSITMPMADTTNVRWITKIPQQFIVGVCRHSENAQQMDGGDGYDGCGHFSLQEPIKFAQ